MTAQLTVAYEHCRTIARIEAKNFYYAFLALPKHKSDAMCAIYAFMRKADDLSDDESISIEDRRVLMQQWLDTWRAARAGGATSDLIFLALNDTQQRFAIPDELLEQLVAGTTMDLMPTKEGVLTAMDASGKSYEIYESFDDLYRYCYLVASVVGLVCIRVFGYSDTRAEKFAEHTGIAFQLTNILRDVREDAERGRIYLPLEDMNYHGVTAQQILDAQNANAGKAMLPLLRQEIERAREYYKAADELIPLLDRDARAAMQVLAAIYRELLERIAASPAQVFSTRMGVPASRKLTLLGKGMVLSFVNRMIA
ncbi:MAG: phytoene/squalene synthase family protein [Acidobacteria bacterium]|nr:phytoene/squalene synthase family protein [Acidobacteriota bacterium]